MKDKLWRWSGMGALERLCAYSAGRTVDELRTARENHKVAHYTGTAHIDPGGRGHGRVAVLGAVKPMDTSKGLWGRLTLAPDTEGEQAILRVVLLAAILAYYALFVAPANGWTANEKIIAAGIAGFLVIALGIVVYIYLQPSQVISRRFIGIINDNGAATFYLCLAGSNGVLMIFVYLFVAFGNGARYGPRYMFASAAMSWAGFTSAMIVVPYWQTHRWEGLQLLVALVCLPPYVAKFLQMRDNETARLRIEVEDLRRRLDGGGAATEAGD